MGQYKDDEKRFIELFSKFTGIRQDKLEVFLQDNPVNLIMEHTDLIEVTPKQREKLKALRELKNIYSAMKSNNKEYTLSNDSAAGAYFLSYFGDVKEREHFACSFLNTKNQVIATKILSSGSVSEAAVFPREIVKAALLHDANGVIIAHNHPSGNPEPSQADLALTQNINEALATMRIKLVDHIITGSNAFVSLTSRGMIDNRPINSFSKVAGTQEVIASHYTVRKQDMAHVAESLYTFANQRDRVKLLQLVDQIGDMKDRYMDIAMIKCATANNFTTAGFLLRNGADFERFKTTWNQLKDDGVLSPAHEDFFKRIGRYHEEVIGKQKMMEPMELKRGKLI